MNRTRTRLAGLAAVLGTIAVLVPASAAGAATTDGATSAAVVATGWDGSPAVVDPAVVPAGTVIGPTFTTTAPATFINTNTQVASGANSAGAQSAP
jgi:hypothetical protein